MCPQQKKSDTNPYAQCENVERLQFACRVFPAPLSYKWRAAEGREKQYLLQNQGCDKLWTEDLWSDRAADPLGGACNACTGALSRPLLISKITFCPLFGCIWRVLTPLPPPSPKQDEAGCWLSTPEWVSSVGRIEQTLSDGVRSAKQSWFILRDAKFLCWGEARERGLGQKYPGHACPSLPTVKDVSLFLTAQSISLLQGEGSLCVPVTTSDCLGGNTSGMSGSSQLIIILTWQKKGS